MHKLSIHDFSIYFQAVHGYVPFPWQEELARQVITTGAWPSLLDLPTSSGKTAVIDIGVFHLAMNAGDALPRKAPLRMFFVIDRRIVVDEAYRRAAKIADSLRSPHHPVLVAMAESLAKLSGNIDAPLDVVRLRGGMPQERDWARSPVQPLVAVSTVDQVGSRLLFRGYGVSNRMRPVHAGLTGSDALWLLDEVHLSQPFEQTLAAIASGHPQHDTCGLLAERPRLAPFSIVRLSATPGTGRPENVFPGSFDIRAGAPNTFLQRMVAEKKAVMKETGSDPSMDFVQYALLLLRGESASGEKKGRNKGRAAADDCLPVKRMAVVVNRVALARQVFAQLARAVGESAEVLLLTGRVRPTDREQIMARLQPLFSGMNRREPDRPIIVVATQTIEAGADFDVDALVTEIAPLDCLRQRFGRLDRLGHRGSSRAVILCPPGKPVPKSDKAGQRKCPWRQLETLYGEAPFATRQWLGKFKNAVDFGVDAMASLLTEVKDDLLVKLLAPRTNAPYLLPSYTGLWASTAPVPQVTPEPSLFLHGPGKMPEVRVVWRADVSPGSSPVSLDMCPPASPEVLSLPLWAVRRWLQHQPDNLMADVPQSDPHNGRQQTSRIELAVLRAEGDAWRWIAPAEIRPDDLIVVPVSYGGCDIWGWNPDCRYEVADRGLEAHYLQRLRCAVRVSAATLTNAWKHEPTLSNSASALDVWRGISTWLREAGDDVSIEALVRLLLEEPVLPTAWRSLLTACTGHPMLLSWQDESDHQAGFTLSLITRLPEGLLDMSLEREADGPPALTGRLDSSLTGSAVTLLDHSLHVEHLVRDFCGRSAMSEDLSRVLILAARLHDLGKAEPRFQADLHGGGILAMNDPVFAALLAPARKLLAKSARIDGGQRGTRRGATPASFRHEALSVVLAGQHPAVAVLSEEDRELVLWLIGTHHGFGRPFFPPCKNLASEVGTVFSFDGSEFSVLATDCPLCMDQGWFELAERVQRRFGPWELARLETILRLADHAASATEQQAGANLTEAQHG